MFLSATLWSVDQMWSLDWWVTKNKQSVWPVNRHWQKQLCFSLSTFCQSIDYKVWVLRVGSYSLSVYHLCDTKKATSWIGTKNASLRVVTNDEIQWAQNLAVLLHESLRVTECLCVCACVYCALQMHVIFLHKIITMGSEKVSVFSITKSLYVRQMVPVAIFWRIHSHIHTLILPLISRTQNVTI